MRSPYGMDIIESCVACPLAADTFFCSMSTAARRTLNSIKATAAYPRGAILSLEGQPPRGVFLLCTGRAKVYSTSNNGKNIMLRIAGPGEVMGLTAVLSGKPYEATVETLQPTQASFVPRADFMAFLQQYPELGLKIADQLVHNCKCAYDEIRSLGLSHSVSEKLARLLLQWADHPVKAAGQTGEIHMKVLLTQDEIAQIIGSSRETVTRLLSEFKSKKLIRVKGTSMVVMNKPALQRMVSS